MSKKVFKKVCTCENCGNEAEMTVTCSIDSMESDSAPSGETIESHLGEKKKTRGHAVCSHCGAEADIWLDT